MKDDLLDGIRRVDTFLQGMVEASALGVALDVGIVDHLAATGGTTVDALVDRFPGHGSMSLLLELLATNGVVDRDGPRIALAPQFVDVLPHQDLIEAKINLSRAAAIDLATHPGDFLFRTQEFVLRSRSFQMFQYREARQRLEDVDPQVANWVGMLTALTRHEAAVFLEMHDVSAYRSVLDIGGNSGELAIQMCKRSPSIRAMVWDLPGVCAVGRQHVRIAGLQDRIAFEASDALVADPPGTFDLVVLKSILHDWDDGSALRLLRQADRCVGDGGELVVFERAPIHLTAAPLPFGHWGTFVFERSYRGPMLYVEALQDLDYDVFPPETVEIDFPFTYVRARKR